MAENWSAPAVDAVVDQWCLVMRSLHNWRLGQSQPWIENNVTIPQLKAVGLLGARPAGLSGRELASLLGVGPSAVTPLVDRLVEHGWARRQEDRADRRITRLFITPEGQGLLDRMVAGQRELIANALRHLDPSELEAVARGIDAVHRGIRRATASSPDVFDSNTACARNVLAGTASTSVTERTSNA